MNTKLNHIKNPMELAKQANWSVSRMAKICNVSSRTMERFFHKNFGKAPKAWLKEQSLKQAQELLRQGSSVKETAAALGYNHAYHFSNDFKKHYGYWPTEFGMGQGNVKCRVFA